MMAFNFCNTFLHVIAFHLILYHPSKAVMDNTHSHLQKRKPRFKDVMCFAKSHPANQ